MSNAIVTTKLSECKNFLTVKKTASKAAPMTSVTLALRSFKRSSIGGTITSRSLPNGIIMPFANPSKMLAAVITQLMLASFCTQLASDLASSANSDASRMRGAEFTRARISSRTSFLSFHFDDVRLVCMLDGSLGTMSTGSTSVRGSGRSISITTASAFLQIAKGSLSPLAASSPGASPSPAPALASSSRCCSFVKRSAFNDPFPFPSFSIASNASCNSLT